MDDGLTNGLIGGDQGIKASEVNCQLEVLDVIWDASN